ncbi:otubain, partial [Trifolium pratense]
DMDDDYELPNKSREVVLGIRKQNPVQDVEPINCANPVKYEAVNCEAPTIEIDTSEHFVPKETYKDRDELIKWVKGQAEKLHFTVVIVRSDQGLVSGKPCFMLGYEQGGVYRLSNKKARKKISIEERGSRKIGCPFRLRGYLPKLKEWNLTIVSGIHNHVLDKVLQGHLVVGRLKPEEKEMVAEMSENLIPPRNIMSTLKK